MTAQQPEQDQGLTPAQQAIIAAAAIGALYRPDFDQLSAAYLAGAISRTELVQAAGRLILAVLHRASISGAIAVEARTGHPPTPRPITPDDQRFVEQSVRTAVDHALETPRKPEEPNPLPDKLTELSEHMAKARARQSYAEGVASVFRETSETFPGDIPVEKETPETLAPSKDSDEPLKETVWRFIPDAGACGRCRKLAEREFEDPESAPANGGHPSCGCSLEPTYKIRSDQ